MFPLRETLSAHDPYNLIRVGQCHLSSRSNCLLGSAMVGPNRQEPPG